MLETACYLLGLAVTLLFPAYNSFKCISKKESAHHWLAYWIVYALWCYVEPFADFVFGAVPLYHQAKLGMLIYLVLPQTKGAHRLYVTTLEPFLLRHESKADSLIAAAQSKAEGKALELKQKAVSMLSEKGKDAQVYLFQMAANLASQPTAAAAVPAAAAPAAATPAAATSAAPAAEAPATVADIDAPREPEEKKAL